MSHLLGIDLGTSAVKAVVIDERGSLLGTGSRETTILSPGPGWAEQEPEEWWSAAVAAVRHALLEAGGGPVAAIGLSGQMHGTLLLDREQRTLGRAIIWADQRSAAEVAEIRALLGDDLLRRTGTAPAAGFMASTLRWLQKHEPRRLERAASCLFPKDYLRLRLTGEVATETTDGAGSGLFDVAARAWCGEALDRLELPRSLFPQALEPATVAGSLSAQAAGEPGLAAGVPVVAGCADQPAQAVGNGLLDPGSSAVTIGSGGQLFVPLDAPGVDERLRVHTFCHAPADRWYMLGAMLSAGLSLRWLRNLAGLEETPDAYRRLDTLAAEAGAGAGGLLFLPYLTGERAPVMDPLARGAFVGLSLAHGPGQLARAVMEGVAFALRQILETAEAAGARVGRLLASGNGLGSPLWRQVLADVLDRPLSLMHEPERAGAGAALVAGIGVGLYSGYGEVSRLARGEPSVTEPDRERASFYAEHYGRYLQLYPALADLLHQLGNPGESA